jgi:hypothetical protein
MRVEAWSEAPMDVDQINTMIVTVLATRRSGLAPRIAMHRPKGSTGASSRRALRYSLRITAPRVGLDPGRGANEPT